MTRSELLEELHKNDLRCLPATINHAVSCGHVNRPTKNGAGLYEYTTEHFEQMKKYLTSPRRSGSGEARGPNRRAVDQRQRLDARVVVGKRGSINHRRLNQPRDGLLQREGVGHSDWPRDRRLAARLHQGTDRQLEKTLKAALDFTVRASNREAYVAPDRGAQGNALMTLAAMPRVVDSEHGKLIVQAHGKWHSLTCGADPISQRAVIHDDASDQPTVGTTIRIQWSPRKDADDDVVWPFGDELFPLWDSAFADRFRSIAEGYSIFNPHAAIALDWFGEETTWEATDAAWEKWKPSEPTSAHWYEPSDLERLIAAYITHDRDAKTDRLVSDLLIEFVELSGSQKRSKVLADADMKRAKLSGFVIGDRLDSKRIERLLKATQKHTRPINPRRLGIIGEEHLRERFLAMGVQPDSFRYAKKLSKGGVPWVLESAFGWLGEGLEAVLTDRHVGAHEPIVFCLHLVDPRVEYTDRGKSAIVIRGAA